MVRSNWLYLCLLSIGLKSSAQPDWHLAKENGGIKVYTASSDSSKFKSIKVEALLEGSIEKLVSVLLDIDHHTKWVYSTKKSYLIKKFDNNDVLYYAETSLPWPMNNRDGPIRMKIFQDTLNKVLTVVTRGEPDAIPEKEGIVRIPKFKANWTVKPADNGKISILYYLDVDPGGSTPAWLVNMFVNKGPYETFSKLAGQLKN